MQTKVRDGISLAFVSYSVSNVNGAHGLGVQSYGTTAHASSSLSRHSTSPKVQHVLQQLVLNLYKNEFLDVGQRGSFPHQLAAIA